MPAFQVTGPDGRKYKVDVPEGATDQDAIAYVYDTYYTQAAAKPEPEPEPERTLGGYTKEAFKGLVPGLVGLGETAITGAAALLPEGAEQAVRKPVEEFATGVRETFAPAPGYEDTAVRKLSEAVGSTLPFLPLGALGLAGRVGAAGLGVAAGAGEARQRAETEGATEGERAAATALGIAPGALESLPPIRILRRFGFGDEAIKEVAGLAPALGRIVKAGGEEALQEASSQVLQNLIAKGVYKPEEAVFGGVGEAAALGGGAGAVVSAIAELALGRRLRGPEERVTEEPSLPEVPGVPEVTSPAVVEPAGIPPEAFTAAKDYVAKIDSGEVKFNLFKARKLIRDMGYEVDNKSKLDETRTLLNDILGAKETDLGMLTTGEFVPEEVSRGTVAAPTDETVAGAVGRGAVVPPFGVGTAEPSVAEPTVAGVVPAAAPAEPTDVGEGALGPALTAPDRVSEQIINSGAGSDFVKNLYSPDPVDAVLTDFNLDEVTPEEISQSKDYIKNISQNLLRDRFGDEITLYRGLKGTEDKAPVLSYSLDKNVAKFQAEQQGIRTGEIEEIKVPVSQVLSYSEAIGRGTFGEEEVIIPADARPTPTTAPVSPRPRQLSNAANSLKELAKTTYSLGALDRAGYMAVVGELNKEVPDIGVVRSKLTKAAKAAGIEVQRATPKMGLGTKKFMLDKKGDRDALTQIADLMLQNAPSESESLNYAEDYLDPFGVSKETIKSKPGVNARRMAKMLGPQLYGDPSDMGVVTIKEILQNSFDSIKGMIDNGELAKGKIDIDVDPDNRIIEMTDNGRGMTPQLLGTKFLEIAGTGKDAKTPSGGFGIAKMLFLYGNKGIRVTTMRDGKVAEMVTNGEQLFDALENPEFAPNILVRAPTKEDLQKFPDGHGTNIALTIPENFNDPTTGEVKEINMVSYQGSIKPLIKSPLFADIDVSFFNRNYASWGGGRDAVPIGSSFPYNDYTEFTNVKFPWGNARVYVAPSEETYGDNLHVLSNGLYQFSQKVAKDPTSMWSPPVPFQFYVDIKPTVKPEDTGYPFTFNRKDFTEQAKKDYGKIMSYINALYAYQDISNSASSRFGSIQYFDSPNELSAPIEVRPTVPPAKTMFAGIQQGDNVTVEDGKLFVRGKELPELTPEQLREGIPKADQLKVDPELIDPNRVMLHDNLKLTSSDQTFSDYMRQAYGDGFDRFMYDVGDIFKNLRNYVVDVLGSDYNDLLQEAVGVSFDKEYRGVSIRVPFSGSFVNPFATRSVNTLEAAYGAFGTMIHELAHFKVRSHNSDFPAEMQLIEYKLQAADKKKFDQYQSRLVDAFNRYQDIFEAGWRLVNESGSLEARGDHFKDGSREDAGKPADEGIPSGKRRSSGKGRAGQRVQPRAVPSTQPTRPGRPSKSTTAAPSGPVDNRGQTPEQAIKTRQDTYRERYTRPKLTDRILKYLWGKEAGGRRLDKYEALAKKFQNDLRPAFSLERALKRSGDLITYGPGMNDAYTKITNAQDKAAWLSSTMLKVPMDRAYKSIERYAKSRNLTTDQAIEELDRFRIVLHEPERRMVMFMRYAPLSTKRRPFRDSNGRTIQISPAELRENILRALVKPGNDLVSNGQAKQLNRLLKALVSDPNNLDPLGDSPIKKEGKPMATDINSDQYSVLAGYSPAFIQQWKRTYDALGTQKATADAAIKAIEDVQDVTKDLNRMAKYWSQPVDNIVEFYDFKHYTPFKGVPGTKIRAEAEMTDPNDVRISGEFADADQAMEGRQSEADNSVLQSFSDALYAASRAGRAGVTEAVKNLIEQGHISGRKVAEITHEERWLDKEFNLKQFKGKNKLFHYNDAGNIEVYEISPKDIGVLEAIRRPYQVDNWAVKWGNNITGLFGQMHTRFNPSFAPLNFPRDIFTNTLAISADVGGKEAATYLSDALFRNVLKGGLYKSGKVSKLIHEGNIAKLRELAKKDPFYADVIEWIQEGGRTVYQQSYNMQAQADELEALIGPSGVGIYEKAKEAIFKWADIYNDAFEFTNRVAAYGVMKNNVMGRLKNEFREKSNRSPNAQETARIEQAAKEEAASFAKNLANFRLVGTAGREAGALFMFFRAASTGAVRAIDSLLPALVDEKTALSRAPESIRSNPESSRRFLKDFRENKRRAQWTIFLTSAAGAFLYAMALAGADDDEEGRNPVATDDMARWTRYARLPVLGKETFLQIPWGFGLSSFGSIGAQIAALAHGNESAKDAVANIVNIAFDSFIPLPKSNINVFDNFIGFLVDSVTPSTLRPVVEYAMNTDNLGNEIYNNRQSRYSDVFTGGKNVPDLYKDLAKLMFEQTGVEVSPSSVYFWATNYADALSRVASSAWDLQLFASGDRQLRNVDDLDKLLVPLDSFIGTRSNYDARQYEDVKEQIQKKQRILNSLQYRGEEYRRYIEKNPMDPEIVDYYNRAVNGELKTLQADAKFIRMSDQFNAQERRDLLKENTRLQNMTKRNLIDMFKYYGIEPEP